MIRASIVVAAFMGMAFAAVALIDYVTPEQPVCCSKIRISTK